LSWLVGTLGVMAEVIILAEYNNKPAESWPYPFTINTAISVLAVIAQGAFMVSVSECLNQARWLWFANRTRKLYDFQAFDAAGRGFWGSLLFLVRLGPLWVT